MKPLLTGVTALCYLLPFICLAQDQPVADGITSSLPSKFYDKVSANAAETDQQLSRQSAKYLDQLSRIESRLRQQMGKVDTAVATHLPAANYAQWITRLQAPATGQPGIMSIYSARLDTLQTTLRFLTAQQGTAGALTNINPQLIQASASVQQLQAHLDETTLINQYIAQRKQAIAQYLGQFTSLPSGIMQSFNQYKATAFYYRQQLETFKSALNDPKKIERGAITQLSKLPAYQQFLTKHSLLASLFQLPAGYGSDQALQGLQTRDQVQQMIQQQVSAGGAGGQSATDQQMQQAQNQLSKMQNNVSKYGAGGQDLDMPNFTPNQQKTKNFLGRLTYGFNLQLQKSTTYYPVTGNLGLSVGYKINDKSSVGAGISYDIGLGSGWSHMQFSSQGIGLRSYMDWKIKKTYYVVGGYEETYMTQFNNIAQLQNRSAWQPSALIGLEKKYKISSKLQGNLQLLFDALYKQEIPTGQMFKVRVGYNF